MIDDHSVALGSDRLVDKPYSLGNTAKGYDCLNSLISFYKMVGIDFPSEFEGINEKNYPEIWNKDQDTAREIFVRFLKSLGVRIDLHHYCRGDLLLFQVDSDRSIFPGIYTGNGNVLICWGKDKGLRMISLKTILKYLVEVRRLG